MKSLPVGINNIRRAYGAESTAVSNLVQLAFHMQSAQPVEHIFGAKHFKPEEWQVAEVEDSLVGCAGFLNRHTTADGLDIEWAVVLGVATHPDWQGRGIMSSLLNHGIADIDARGIPISFLRGKRTRYSRFGWIEAGQRLGCALFASQFPAPSWKADSLWHYVGTGADTDASCELAQRIMAVQSRALRSLPAQEAMVARKDIHTLYVEADGGKAYAIAGGPKTIKLGWPPGVQADSRLLWLYELGGEWSLVDGLIGYMLQDNNGPLYYLASPWLPPNDRKLWEKADAFGIATPGMIRIHNLELLLLMYKKWWADQQRCGSGSVVIHMRCEPPEASQRVRLLWTPDTVEVEPVSATQIHAGETVISGWRQNITNAIFGPLDPAVALGGEPGAGLLRDLFPLPLNLPRLDQI